MTEKKDGFLKKLISVQEKDINLKFIFDNIRNYGIAAIVLGTGLHIARYGSHINSFPGLNCVVGIGLIVLGFALFCLNVSQAIQALIELKISIIPYLIVTLLIFFGATELIWGAL